MAGWTVGKSMSTMSDELGYPEKHSPLIYDKLDRLSINRIKKFGEHWQNRFGLVPKTSTHDQ